MEGPRATYVLYGDNVLLNWQWQMLVGMIKRGRELTPSCSMVTLCSYCPSKGYPKKPIAKCIAEDHIRSLCALLLE